MDNSNLQWVIKGVLARGCRPCFDDDVPSGFLLNAWLKELAGMEIKAVLCLLCKGELEDYYGTYGINLLAWYRHRGIMVGHVPIPDHLQTPVRKSDLVKIWSTFRKLPKPCLIHCSAGIDRTGAAVQFIQKQRD